MMQGRVKAVVTAATLALLSPLIYKTGGAVPARAETAGFNDEQVKSIEQIVHEYIVKHPEVLLEAQEAFERKAEAQRVSATRSRLPQFYKEISALKPELSGFTVGNGDVTLVEFFDYNCGYCRATLPDLVKLVDNDKNLKVQFMELPILAPQSAEASKVAVAAAKQGKYFEFHKAMFAAGRASKESALKVAAQIGLDMNKVQADMAAPETEALISKVSEIAKQMSVDGTPSFIIGDTMNPGAASYDQLKQMVEEVRKDGCKACTAANAKDDNKKS